MNATTIKALNRINLAFYQRSSEPFSESRRRSWPGWRRVLATVEAGRSHTDSNGAALHILDVGCGNGRFGRLLERSFAAPFRYLGVDSSAELLAVAAERLPSTGRGARSFHRLDLVSRGAMEDLGEQRWDLIVVFGLLHHIPSLDHRRFLLTFLAQRLRPAGVLALSFWQFGSVDRFRRRIISWADHNRLSEEKIDLDQLESGDLLLAWGDLPPDPESLEKLGPRRYCHYADPGEARHLVSWLGLPVVDHFLSDGHTGDMNLYFVLRSPG